MCNARRLRLTLALSAALAALSAGPAAANDTVDVPLEEIGVFAPDSYSSDVTDCDRLAAHPSDPNAVTEGVSRAEMDKPAAIAACLAAVKSDPGNPRLKPMEPVIRHGNGFLKPLGLIIDPPGADGVHIPIVLL